MTTAVLEGVINAEAELSDGELVAECKARANIYRILSGAFLEEPTAEYLQAIRSPEVMASLRGLGAAFGPDFTDAPIGQLQEELAQEYAVLFVVTGGCPAVESIRLYGRFQQQSFFEVRKIYQQAGFKVSGGRFMVFDDQLGAELMYVAAMLDRAAVALAGGNRSDYVETIKSIKRFWALHLGKWVRGYASLLGRATEYSFYREIAKLLGSFAEWELGLLGVRVDDVDGGKLKVPLAEIEYESDSNEPVCNACEKGQPGKGKSAADQLAIDISLIEERLQRKK
ncbi:MAG: molecular chaperone TorD family protein [Nitrosomonadales bacterium]|nr:molecular chaperone TorD family protein [Nitrosomonadales bacterium]